MNALATLISALSFAFQIAIVLGLPLAVARAGRNAVGWFAPSDFFEVPVVIGAARLLGILLGAFVLSGRADVFNLRLLFGPESPWNLTTWQFLSAPANPLWSLHGLIGEIANHGFGLLFGSLTAFIGLLFLAVLLTPFAFWRGPDLWRAAIGAGCVAIITTYMTIYGVSLLFWLLFLLNFWVLGLLLVILQWYRSRT